MKPSPFLRLLLAFVLLLPSTVYAESKTSQVKAPPSSMQIIRRLLGISQRVAAAGSRSDPLLGVCLITPALNPAQNDQANTVLLSNPVLVSKEPLNEVQIDLGDQQWRALASSKKDVGRTVIWPYAPLQGGETILIRFRSKGSPGGDYSELTLIAAPAEVLAQNSTLITRLGSNEKSWINAIESISINNPKLAVALLFSASAPDSVLINQLRTSLIQNASCK